MTCIFRVAPILLAAVLVTACNAPPEATNDVQRGPEEPRAAGAVLERDDATPRGTDLVIIRDEPPPPSNASTTPQFTRRVTKRAALLDRDIATIGYYLPTFQGQARADLDAALAEIEARRAKLTIDLAALRSTPDEETDPIKNRIDYGLDALELDVARALVKARAPSS